MASSPRSIRATLARKETRKRPGKISKADTYKPTISEAHRKVINAYFENGCVSQKRAMLAAGYATTTSMHMPHTVFGREDVKAEIEKRHRLHERKQQVTEERIIQELAKLAFVSQGDLLEVNEDGTAYVDFNKLTPEMKAGIAEIKNEKQVIKSQLGAAEDGSEPPEMEVNKTFIKFASKQAALDSLARIKGMFKEKIEVSTVGSLVDRIAAARARLVTDKKPPSNGQD